MSNPIEPKIQQFASWRNLDVRVVSEYVEGVVTGFIDALLWSESCRGTIEGCDHVGMVGEEAQNCDRSISDFLNENDLSGEAYELIRSDAVDFTIENWDDLHDEENRRGMDPEQAGHDFLLTRNGHGTGFWDRGLGERGDRLTQDCKNYSEMSAMVSETNIIEVN